MKVIFGTVLYKKALMYSEDLVQTINQQDCNNFEVLIINDDVEFNELKRALRCLQKKYSMIEYSQNYSPVELRIRLLYEAKKINTDLLIIGDADDIFSSNRIANIIKSAQLNPETTFFYNKIVDFSGQPMMPDLPEATDSIENIIAYNYLGMSNTSIRIRDVSEDFIGSLYECCNPIFDWYLFSRLLLEGKKGIYVQDAQTLYRLYNENIVGDQTTNPQKIDYEVQVKLQHYKLLKDRSKKYETLYQNYSNGKYILNENRRNYFWWNYTDSIY